MSTILELSNLVQAIPKGKVCAYGSLGRALKNPVPGFFVGRWMASIDEGAPWWRVVAKSGQLPISKRDTQLAIRQAMLLEREGVVIHEGKIDMEFYAWEPEW